MRAFRKIARLLNKIIKKGHWYREVAFPDCEKFWTYKTFNTDVMNLGSSSALNAFNYEEINLKCANFALRHNPILADLAILKNYHSFLKPNATVIIALCPFTSFSGNYEYFEDRYYTLLLPTSMSTFSYRQQQDVKAKRQNPLLHYPLIEVYRDLKHAIFPERSRIRTDEWFENNSKLWMENWMKEFSIESFDAPLSVLNQDSICCAASIINEIIAFCMERNFHPVMVVPPMHHTLSEKFTPEIRKVLFDSMLEKVNNKEVNFLNYMDDSVFSYDNNLFRDAFLLNIKGAKLFTKELIKQIHG